jgi:hypothetical protein
VNNLLIVSNSVIGCSWAIWPEKPLSFLARYTMLPLSHLEGYMCVSGIFFNKKLIFVIKLEFFRCRIVKFEQLGALSWPRIEI